MREIKFRGKIATTNSWVYGNYAFVEGYHVIYDYVFYENGKPLIIKLNTLGQYTGLKDKNGTKIYEGDIVHQFPKEGYGSIVMNGKIGVVEFGYGAFHIRNINDHRTNFFFYTEQEVIGNIHEHKHLLEGK